MKPDHRYRLTNTLLALLIAASGVFCLATAFDLSYGSALRILLFLAGFSLLCDLSLCYRRGGLIFCLVFVGAICLAARQLLPPVEKLLSTISKFYNGGYGWGYLRWSDTDLRTVSLDPALILVGYLVIFPVLWTLHRRKWAGLGLLAGILPLAACCVVTDTIPNGFCLFGLLAGELLLLLPQLTRRRSAEDGQRLTALLLIPVLLFTGALTLYSGLDPHANQAQALQQRLEALFSGAEYEGSTGLNSETGTVSANVDLTAIGPQTQSTRVVMWLEADTTGLVYLRGQAYDTYIGTRWRSTLDTAGEGGWPIDGLTDMGQLTLVLNVKENLKYFPYYILSDADDSWTETLINGHMDNPGRKTVYTFQRAYATGSDVYYTPLRSSEVSAYVSLPETTMNQAQDILLDILDGTETTAATVSAIAAYVRSSAEYDLNTQAMPDYASDFAIWFLEESDTGYCVHFASAATVLLRAAGIPARYVTGYIAYTVAGYSTSVFAYQSHAWVEYLDPEQGWTVLEATPGAEQIPPIAETVETTQPEETTLPEETENSTDPVPAVTRPSNTTPATTLPAGTIDPSMTDDTVSVRDLSWLRPVFWCLIVCVLLWGQYTLRLTLRRKRLHQGEANRQALRRWRYVCRLARLTRQTAPQELRFLAEKAAFSQHTLTADELRQFSNWIRCTQQRILDKPLPLRLLLQLVLAIS